jgi:hypothetical protein
MPFTFEVEFTSPASANQFTHWLADITGADWSGIIEDDCVLLICKNLTFRELRMCGDMEDQLRKTEGDYTNAITN